MASRRWAVADARVAGEEPAVSSLRPAHASTSRQKIVARTLELHPSPFALRPATVVGRHCESGDLLAEDVSLPDDVHAGDLLAVPCSGAYHHSMASNYNFVGRPPVVAVADGQTDLLVRRETEEDLLRRDVG
jgi:diaminopimelate decarboxylase